MTKLDSFPSILGKFRQISNRDIYTTYQGSNGERVSIGHMYATPRKSSVYDNSRYEVRAENGDGDLLGTANESERIINSMLNLKGKIADLKKSSYLNHPALKSSSTLPSFGERVAQMRMQELKDKDSIYSLKMLGDGRFVITKYGKTVSSPFEKEWQAKAALRGLKNNPAKGTIAPGRKALLLSKRTGKPYPCQVISLDSRPGTPETYTIVVKNHISGKEFTIRGVAHTDLIPVKSLGGYEGMFD